MIYVDNASERLEGMVKKLSESTQNTMTNADHLFIIRLLNAIIKTPGIKAILEELSQEAIYARRYREKKKLKEQKDDRSSEA